MAAREPLADLSRDRWLRDLSLLLTEARRRFADVAWSVADTDGATEDFAAHKAILYARAGPQFQATYLSSNSRLLSPSIAHHPSASNLSLPCDESRLSVSPLTVRSPSPGAFSVGSVAQSHQHHQPSLAPIVLRDTSSTFFRNCLEFFYTADTSMSNAFSFLFDDGPLNDDASNKQAAIHKLSQDMLYVWRSKLFSDVRLTLVHDSSSSSSDHVYAVPHGLENPSNEVDGDDAFVAHRFILCCRSSYFANLMLSAYSDSDSRNLVLPSPPFTSASLHFVLGYIYSGTLHFSTRRFDLSTAFAIWRCAQFLGIDLLRDEIEAEIEGMCRGREGNRRAGRVLKFASSPDVQATKLTQDVRAIVVASPAETFNRDIGELDYDIQKDIVNDLVENIGPLNLVSVFKMSRAVSMRVAGEKAIWADHLKSMLEPIDSRIQKTLSTDLDQIIVSPDFLNLIEGVGFSADILQSLLETLVQSLTEKSAPNAYQVLVGQVLLREEGIMTNIRLLVEEARKGILRYIGTKWVGIHGYGAFDPLQDWALKEISDETEVPVDDLLSSNNDAEPTMTKSGLHVTPRRSTKLASGSPHTGATTRRSPILNRSIGRNGTTPTTSSRTREFQTPAKGQSNNRITESPGSPLAQRSSGTAGAAAATQKPASTAASIRSEASRRTTASAQQHRQNQRTNDSSRPTGELSTTATKSRSVTQQPLSETTSDTLNKTDENRNRISESLPSSKRLAQSTSSSQQQKGPVEGSNTKQPANLDRKTTTAANSNGKTQSVTSVRGTASNRAISSQTRSDAKSPSQTQHAKTSDNDDAGTATISASTSRAKSTTSVRSRVSNIQKEKDTKTESSGGGGGPSTDKRKIRPSFSNHSLKSNSHINDNSENIPVRKTSPAPSRTSVRSHVSTTATTASSRIRNEKSTATSSPKLSSSPSSCPTDTTKTASTTTTTKKATGAPAIPLRSSSSKEANSNAASATTTTPSKKDVKKETTVDNGSSISSKGTVVRRRKMSSSSTKTMKKENTTTTAVEERSPTKAIRVEETCPSRQAINDSTPKQSLAPREAPGTTLNVGIPCVVTTEKFKFQALVKYLGDVLFDNGPFVGVEVFEDHIQSSSFDQNDNDKPLPWNNGSIDGVRYFALRTIVETDTDMNASTSTLGGGMTAENNNNNNMKSSMISAGSRPPSARSFARNGSDVYSVASQNNTHSSRPTIGLFIRPHQVI